MDYIKRVDAVNALLDDEDLSPSEYTKQVYDRLTTMRREPVVRTADVMGIICRELRGAADDDQRMQLLVRIALELIKLEDKEA